MIEFQGFPKIARLFRDIVITEKIDGTNGAIGIISAVADHDTHVGEAVIAGDYLVYAQSRSRVIWPGMDNHGFARWAWENAEALTQVLGPGLHFGEWWGSGVNRGYGLTKGEKRFSLFNTKRWAYYPETAIGAVPIPELHEVPGLTTVPVLYQGEFSTVAVEATKADLRLRGSCAAPGFMNPEGVVIFHTSGNVMFKSTLIDDELPKAIAERKQSTLRLAA